MLLPLAILGIALSSSQAPQIAPLLKVRDELRFVILAYPFSFERYAPKFKKSFERISHFRTEDIRDGILTYLREEDERPAILGVEKRSGFNVTIALFTLNRYLFDVPEGLVKSSYLLDSPTRDSNTREIWPWTKKDGKYVIDQQVPQIPSKGSYTWLTEFDEMSQQFGRRKITGPWLP